MSACAFCGTFPVESTATKCRQCGAPLPLPGDRGRLPEGALQRIPRPPRKTTLKQISGGAGFLVAWGGIFGGIGGGIGCLFVIIGLATLQIIFAGVGLLVLLVFGSIGGTALAFGYRKASRELRTYKIGEAVEATLIAADEDTSMYVNGRHPIRVSYTFPWQGEERGGECSTLDARARRFQEGDAVVILVDPENPESQALYLR